MSQIHLTEIHLYPVKSLAGFELQHSRLDGFGLLHDRRWMVVDGEGRFLSQRELPRMTLIHAALEGNGITLTAPDMLPLKVRRPDGESDRIAVQIWRDRCEGTPAGRDADEWLSRFLGVACRLVHMGDDVFRQVDQRYAGPEHRAAFSDGFPLLLISQGSLDDLNSRLDEPLPMSRFRPNLVVSGCDPYAEDGWSRIRIGALELQVVKPCSRCSITTVDPLTAERGSEPLKTLASYRRRDNQVYFGQNVLHGQPGEISVGMSVEVFL